MHLSQLLSHSSRGSTKCLAETQACDRFVLVIQLVHCFFLHFSCSFREFEVNQMASAMKQSFPLVLVGKFPFLSTFTFVSVITFTVWINIYSQFAGNSLSNQKIPVIFISCRNWSPLVPFSVFMFSRMSQGLLLFIDTFLRIDSEFGFLFRMDQSSAILE